MLTYCRFQVLYIFRIFKRHYIKLHKKTFIQLNIIKQLTIKFKFEDCIYAFELVVFTYLVSKMALLNMIIH